MVGKVVDSCSGWKEMMNIIESLWKEGERRCSVLLFLFLLILLCIDWWVVIKCLIDDYNLVLNGLKRIEVEMRCLLDVIIRYFEVEFCGFFL